MASSHSEADTRGLGVSSSFMARQVRLEIMIDDGLAQSGWVDHILARLVSLRQFFDARCSLRAGIPKNSGRCLGYIGHIDPVQSDLTRAGALQLSPAARNPIRLPCGLGLFYMIFLQSLSMNLHA
jgi:hypothetical protein